MLHLQQCDWSRLDAVKSGPDLEQGAMIELHSIGNRFFYESV
jgi:hypothetical protein